MGNKFRFGTFIEKKILVAGFQAASLKPSIDEAATLARMAEDMKATFKLDAFEIVDFNSIEKPDKKIKCTPGEPAILFDQ